jgi:soluble lytic murein transglycosylase-like protein
MQHLLHLRLLMAMLVALSAASAGEIAVLKTGYRLHVDRHEINASRVRLFTQNGGQMDLPASAVIRFEQDDQVAEALPVEEPPLESPIEKPLSIADAIERFAAEVGLPAELIHAVISTESAYQTDAISAKGAIGLMQLMPQTAAELAVDPYDPTENVRGGINYLKQLMELYEGREDQVVRALAAYNAGPHRVDQYDGVPPYDETRAYVRRVIERYLRLTKSP